MNFFNVVLCSLSVMTLYVLPMNNFVVVERSILSDRPIYKIDIQGVRAIHVLHNKAVMVNGCDHQPENFVKLIDIKTGDHKDLGKFTYITLNDERTKALLTNALKPADGSKFKIAVYDSQQDKTYASAILLSYEDINCFGSSPNTVLRVQPHKDILSYNYIDHTRQREEIVTCFLKENPDLDLYKFISPTKLLCVRKGIDCIELYVCDATNIQPPICVRKLDHITQMPNNNSFVCCNSDGSLIVTHGSFWGYNYHCYIKKPEIFHGETNERVQLQQDDYCNYSIAIHPNNQFIVTLLRSANIIQYWDAKIGKCVHSFQSSTEREALSILMENNTNLLSFSKDGTLLAAAYPMECMLYNVPFMVNYGVGTKEKLVKILLLLRHYKEMSLTDDIINLLTLETMRVSKL